MNDKFLCKVAKTTSSKEAWKILEEEFGAKRGDMQQQDVSHLLC